MKIRLTIILIFTSYLLSFATDVSRLSKDKTLDIVTWNMEWFGVPDKSKSASSFTYQLNEAVKQIKNLDADIYALQEVIVDNVNGNFLKTLVDKLNESENKWIGIVGERHSYDFRPNYNQYPAQRVCYIYNKNSIEKIESESMFADIYKGTSTSYISGYTANAKYFWATGRLPFLLKAEVTVNNITQTINFINIHAKCCWDSYDRKLADAKYLVNHMNTQMSDDNIVVLGDYNDYYQGSMTNGKSDSPYKSWYSENNKNFKHTFGGNIDHISISNELYDEFDGLTNNTLKTNVSSSDHDPVMVRLIMTENQGSGKKSQTISFEKVTNKSYGDASFTLNATSSANLAIEFESSNENILSISGNIATITGAGTVEVSAIQKGDENYYPKTEVQSIAIGKKYQTMEFKEITSSSVGDIIELEATASSGMDVQFKIVSGNAELSDNTLKLTDRGDLTVKAIQYGNNNYHGVESVQTISVISTDITKDKNFGILLYPNPATDLIFIERNEKKCNAEYFISNINGQILKKGFLNAGDPIKIAEFNPGTYLITVVAEGKKLTKRMIFK